MRAKVSNSKRARTKPVSLYPEHISHATRRSLDCNRSLSWYVQQLIAYDQEHNLLAEILKRHANEAA